MIDWSKPLRTIPNAHSARQVFKTIDGYYVVEWGTVMSAVVDSLGRLRDQMFGLDRFPVGKQIIENVPEEPKDHLHLFLNGSGAWQINYADGFRRTGALQTKEFWDQHNGTSGGVVVKVPVE